mmetsp:Transcript_12060/g.21514  ORF Transcript_12060/g.21514 Transcript_12060/m.21514 type:complete len:99 (+) Transcript_12060:44-340(+)
MPRATERRTDWRSLSSGDSSTATPVPTTEDDTTFEECLALYDITTLKTKSRKQLKKKAAEVNSPRGLMILRASPSSTSLIESDTWKDSKHWLPSKKKT